MAKSKKNNSRKNLKLAKELISYVKTIDDVVDGEYEKEAFIKTLNKCLKSIGAAMDMISKRGEWSPEFEREMHSAAFACGYLYRHEMANFKDIVIKIEDVK